LTVWLASFTLAVRAVGARRAVGVQSGVFWVWDWGFTSGSGIRWSWEELSGMPAQWWPRYHPRPGLGGAWLVKVPLWIPMIGCALPTVLLWWHDRRRILAGECRRCGYDLTGNVSGRCPECGVAVER
jgi:hypothetical protein